MGLVELLCRNMLLEGVIKSPIYSGANQENLPERVIQFGEGNFLRAFVDWMFHELNEHGLFQGQVVVVQPLSFGMINKLKAQDCLYTLYLRGLDNGQIVELKKIITSLSRGLDAYSEWPEVLKCAENPELRFMVSNTTEAGIRYDENDTITMAPPQSFPAKVLMFLLHRYTSFKGDKDKGMVILPCELIERNGDELKKVVLKLAEDWNLPDDFKKWILEYNYFLNTLVDRVVPGYPKDEINEITNYLGYIDNQVTTGEFFHLWVIEGPEFLKEELPFHKLNLNVVWTNDLTLYRTRKVRILNGAHTGTVPAAFLYGLDTVGEMMEDIVLGKFIRKMVYEEIVPSLTYDEKLMRDFADSVMERFQNPYIKHYLLSILLNSSSKFKARVLPSITEYYEKNNKLPRCLVFSLAALISIYKDGQIENQVMKSRRSKGNFEMRDDLEALEFFKASWQDFDNTLFGAERLAESVLRNEKLWGQNLEQLDGFKIQLAKDLYQISTDGIKKAIIELL